MLKFNGRRPFDKRNIQAHEKKTNMHFDNYFFCDFVIMLCAICLKLSIAKLGTRASCMNLVAARRHQQKQRKYSLLVCKIRLKSGDWTGNTMDFSVNTSSN